MEKKSKKNDLVTLQVQGHFHLTTLNGNDSEDTTHLSVGWSGQQAKKGEASITKSKEQTSCHMENLTTLPHDLGQANLL